MSTAGNNRALADSDETQEERNARADLVLIWLGVLLLGIALLVGAYFLIRKLVAKHCARKANIANNDIKLRQRGSPEPLQGRFI